MMALLFCGIATLYNTFDHFVKFSQKIYIYFLGGLQKRTGGSFCTRRTAAQGDKIKTGDFLGMAAEYTPASADRPDNTSTVWQRTAKNRTVRLVILVTGAAYIGAMVYGSGMRRQVKTLQFVNEERKNAQRDYRLAQMDLQMRLASMEQLEARRQVGLAINLVQENRVSDAQTHLEEARRLLTLAQAANTTNADLSAPLANLQQVSSQPRSAQDLMQIAAQMDAALNKQMPELIKSSAASDAAHPIAPPTMNDVPQLPGNDVTSPGPQPEPAQPK